MSASLKSPGVGMSIDRTAAIHAERLMRRERTREGSEPVMIAESCLSVGVGNL
jgi:hypothetical protein